RTLGHEVALFDPMLDEDASVLGAFGAAIDRARPDLVVLYDDSFNWFTKMCLSRMRAVARAMIGEAHGRGLPVIVAGHDAADAPEAYLRAGADFVILGEGEVTLGELLAHIEQANGDLGAVRTAAPSAIPGLALHHHGLLRRSPPRKLLHDLDALPLPAWDLA